MARRKLTKDVVFDSAKRFLSRREFELSDVSAYRIAMKNDWLDAACSHMNVLRRALDKFNVGEIASKFATRKEFDSADPSAYRAALRNGWMDEVCSHMNYVHRSFSKEDVAAIALGFKTRTDFQVGDRSAYQTAWKNGWLNDICQHMRRGATGFDEQKPGYLYQIKFTLPSGSNVWKVGIANRRAKFRVAGMGVPDWVLHEVTHEIRYEDGSMARAEEVRLHGIGLENGLCYDGDSFLKNGNTELFSAPLISQHFKI